MATEVFLGSSYDYIGQVDLERARCDLIVGDFNASRVRLGKVKRFCVTCGQLTTFSVIVNESDRPLSESIPRAWCENGHGVPTLVSVVLASRLLRGDYD